MMKNQRVCSGERGYLINIKKNICKMCMLKKSFSLKCSVVPLQQYETSFRDFI